MQKAPFVTITFKLRVSPSEMGPTESVYLTGSLLELGLWDTKQGIPLKKSTKESNAWISPPIQFGQGTRECLQPAQIDEWNVRIFRNFSCNRAFRLVVHRCLALFLSFLSKSQEFRSSTSSSSRKEARCLAGRIWSKMGTGDTELIVTKSFWTKPSTTSTTGRQSSRDTSPISLTSKRQRKTPQTPLTAAHLKRMIPVRSSPGTNTRLPLSFW